MIYRRKKLQRKTFRELGFGQQFWGSVPGLEVGPFIKLWRDGYIISWDQTTGALSKISLPTVAVPVTEVPREFYPYPGAIGLL